jgi:hypothetical protein
MDEGTGQFDERRMTKHYGGVPMTRKLLLAGLLLNFALVAHGQSGQVDAPSAPRKQPPETIPTCRGVLRTWAGNNETRYQCATPSGNSCYEWEGVSWSPVPELPCGSSVASTTLTDYKSGVKWLDQHHAATQAKFHVGQTQTQVKAILTTERSFRSSIWEETDVWHCRRIASSYRGMGLPVRLPPDEDTIVCITGREGVVEFGFLFSLSKRFFDSDTQTGRVVSTDKLLRVYNYWRSVPNEEFPLFLLEQ